MNSAIDARGVSKEYYSIVPSRQGLRANIEGDNNENIRRLAQWLASDALGMVPEMVGFDEETILKRAQTMLEEVQKLRAQYKQRVEKEVEKKSITRNQVERLTSANAHTRQEEGFDDYYTQFNAVIAAFLIGNPPVEIETVGPYACAHIDRDTRKLEFDPARLPKDERIGLLLAATLKTIAKTINANVRIVTLLDEYNDYTKSEEGYKFSDEERSRFVVFVVGLFTQLGVIDAHDIPGKDYVVLLESRQRPKFGALLERLKKSGKGEVVSELFSGGKEKVVFNPGQDFVSKLGLSRTRRKEFKRDGILLSSQGEPTCQALDASGFLDDQNKNNIHLIMLGDHMKGQQDKVFTLLSALGITNSQRFHNVFFKTEEFPAEVVVFSLLARIETELQKAVSKLEKKDSKEDAAVHNLIGHAVRNALKHAGLHYWDIDFEHPADMRLGDYSTNAAVVLGNHTNIEPQKLAEDIASFIRESSPKWLDRVEVAAPGFVNFYLSRPYFLSQIETIVNMGETWGRNDKLVYKRILIEHSSPNLFKPFHIGHLVNNFIGVSLARIMRFSGAQVEEVSYPSDVSPGIAKTVWAILQKKNPKELTVDVIGEAYVYGSKMYEEDKEAYEAVNSINQQIYTKQKGPALDIYEKGLSLSLAYFKEVTQRLGSVFSGYIFESESAVIGKEIIKENVPNVFSESRGAIIFEGSKYGLFDDVFITTSDTVTYLGKDLGLMQIKADRYDFDQAITITDIEQQQHFRLVKKAAELIDEAFSQRFIFLQHGRLSLSGRKKLSSRFGGVPLAVDLVETLKEEVLQKMQSERSVESEQRAEKIALGALKWEILKSAADHNAMFDLKKSLDISALSGPYVQYAFVRAQGVLDKAQKLAIPEITARKGLSPTLERMLIRFPAIVEKALADYSPHHVASYVLEVAREFNEFYDSIKIIDETNPDFANNIALVKASMTTLRNGLMLLGVETVQEM